MKRNYDEDAEMIYEGVEDLANEYLRRIDAGEDVSDLTDTAEQHARGFVGADGRRYDEDGLPVIRYEDYSQEELRRMFDDFSKAVRGTDAAAKDDAYIKAWQILKRWVNSIIRRQFSSYIASFSDRDNQKRFVEDLESVGRISIFRTLGRYDSSKGAPSTFFGYEIVGDIKRSITREYHQVGNYQPELLKKLEEAEKLFSEERITPSIKDYQIATGLSVRVIEGLLAYRTKKKGDLSFEQACGNIDMTTKTRYMDPDDEAMSNINMDILEKALNDTLDADENLCFRYFVDEMNPSAIAAVVGMELSTVRDKIMSAKKKLKMNKIVCAIARQYYGDGDELFNIGVDTYGDAEAAAKTNQAIDEFFGFATSENTAELKIAEAAPALVTA